MEAALIPTSLKKAKTHNMHTGKFGLGYAKINRMNIRESLRNARLHLWDDKTQRLLSFAQARQLYG